MKKICVLLMFYCYNGCSKEPTIKQVENLIYSIENLSLVYKLTLFSQSILETGYFKNTKYNNIFGIMKNDKKKHYSSFSECINERIDLVNKHHVVIHKNYATDIKYLHKIHKIMLKSMLSTTYQKLALMKYINENCPDYLTYQEYKLINKNISEELFNKIMQKLEYPYYLVDNIPNYVIDKG